MADTVANSLAEMKSLQGDKKANHYQRQSNNKKVSQGRLPVDPKILEKYDFGHKMQKHPSVFGGKHQRMRIVKKDQQLERSRVATARAELLLTEKSGCLESIPGIATTDISQNDILDAANITTQKKRFSLQLDDFGPYKFQYFRDGRHLALAGELGHLACFNWVTKKLSMEINVMESLHDVAWLQDASAIAVAQKKWTSIYDDRGTEIHCVKRMNDIIKLDYLPYHFLLSGLNDHGDLHYLDVSLGKEVLFIRPKQSPAVTMVNNPYNGVMTTAHGGGIVCMWTPNHNEPVGTVICHKSNISSLAYDPAGRYMATTAYDRKLKIWDARNLGQELHSVTLPKGVVRSLSISQKGLVALGIGRDVSVYSGLREGSLTSYLNHPMETQVHQVQFCPYEDILGITNQTGFSSIIIPGAGEANFDALEANPFSNRKTRREALVKNLLEKIPYQHITLDPRSITQVDVPTLEEKMEEKKRLIYMKVPKIDPQPRYRMKGKSGSGAVEKRKLIKRSVHKKRYIARLRRLRQRAGIPDIGQDVNHTKAAASSKSGKKPAPLNIIDVFKKPKKN